MEQGKEPKTSLGKLIHPWRFCCQMQPSSRQKREQSSRQKFDETCCSGSFGSFMFQIVCNSIGWCGMGTSIRVPMPTHPSESAPRFHPSVTKSNRAEPLYRKVRRKAAIGLYLGHDGHGWPWASGDSRDHGKPLRKSPQVSAAMLEDHEWKTVDSVDTTTRPILKYLQSSFGVTESELDIYRFLTSAVLMSHIIILAPSSNATTWNKTVVNGNDACHTRTVFISIHFTYIYIYTYLLVAGLPPTWLWQWPFP